MIEIHMSKTDDNNIKEMYENLGKYRSDYMAGAKFSNHFDGVSLCFHECLQFLYIRNYLKNEMIKSIYGEYEEEFTFILDTIDEIIKIANND